MQSQTQLSYLLICHMQHMYIRINLVCLCICLATYIAWREMVICTYNVHIQYTPKNANILGTFADVCRCIHIVHLTTASPIQLHHLSPNMYTYSVHVHVYKYVPIKPLIHGDCWGGGGGGP